MWVLVWITLGMDNNLVQRHSYDVFEEYYQCVDAKWMVEKSKSIEPTREVIACIKVRRDK